MQNDQIKVLLEKYLTNELTRKEFEALWVTLKSNEGESGWNETMEEIFQSSSYTELADRQKQQQVLNSILQQSSSVPYIKKSRISINLFKYAAAIIITIGIVAYLYFNKKPIDKPDHPAVAEIKPGTNKAVLTLSDGRKMILDDSSSEVINDGAAAINKNNSVLIYANTSALPGYNVMSTPRGGQYQVILPDGSKVWLNSASTLRYPTVFTGKARQVELSGEAYFEIKENKAMPFKVQVNKVAVDVLGTEFNINAYEDEPVIATTLVSGSVKVTDPKQTLIIKPGQQASLLNKEQTLKISTPDLEEVLAWRHGMFQFEDADIRIIMRQIARWYDVDIVYKENIPELKVSGSLLRTESPLSLLKALEKTDRIHFNVEGNKITVNTRK